MEEGRRGERKREKGLKTMWLDYLGKLLSES